MKRAYTKLRVLSLQRRLSFVWRLFYARKIEGANIPVRQAAIFS